MNPTPSDGAAGLSPERVAPDPADGESPARDADTVPASRPGPPPLPRRSRGVPEPTPVPEQEPGRDPDGRRYDTVDEETLNRLLIGLRDI